MRLKPVGWPAVEFGSLDSAFRDRQAPTGPREWRRLAIALGGSAGSASVSSGPKSYWSVVRRAQVAWREYDVSLPLRTDGRARCLRLDLTGGYSRPRFALVTRAEQAKREPLRAA